MSAVLVTLDTRPPALSLVLPATVRWPEVMTVTVSADEPIQHASFSFVDAFGTIHVVGYERSSEQTILVHLPTAGISWGRGILRGWVDDGVCNRTQIARPIEVQRPAGKAAAFDVVLSFEGAFDVELMTDTAYDAVLMSEPAGFQVELETHGDN